MKRTSLAACLVALCLITACGGGANTNTNTNTNRATPAATATPIPANTDPALKSNIETELKKKGFNNVTVDVTTTPATLRGTYPKGKLAEVIQTAQQANGMKPVRNEMSEEN